MNHINRNNLSELPPNDDIIWCRAGALAAQSRGACVVFAFFESQPCQLRGAGIMWVELGGLFKCLECLMVFAAFFARHP